LTFTDEAIVPGRAYYYVVTTLEHNGIESGYSTEAARAGARIPADIDAPLVVYAEAEDALVDLQTGDKPGLSRGRGRLTASNWYYVYRTSQAMAGSAAVPVRVACAARYFVWLRVRRADATPATWKVSVDGRAAGTVICHGEQWSWARASEEPLAVDAGRRTIGLHTSDAGAQADVICLATDPKFTPLGPRPEDRQAPAAARGLKATRVRDRAIQLAWQPGPEPGLWHYNVYAAREPIAAAKQEYLLASPTYPELIDWGLRPDTTYHYVVTAVDRRGNESRLSQAASAVTAPRRHPVQELALRFDQARLSGQVERLKAAGTHADKYVMIPEEADDEAVAQVQAEWSIDIKHAGPHYFWLRFLPKGAASSRSAAVKQSVRVELNGQALTTLAPGDTDLSAPDSTVRPEFWTWSRPGRTELSGVEIPAGQHTLTVKNLTKTIRYDVLLITDEPSFVPADGRLRQR